MARVVVAPRRIVIEKGGFLVVLTGRWVMSSEAFVCVSEIGSSALYFERPEERAMR